MPAARNLTAVLGPTNTGKTHLAVERMLGSPSGMIGLPLRLLAREVYDRVRLRAGDKAVALVTGEEKIIPPEPRYWVCTVEAMPSDIEVSFLAIDEVQLAGDFERGHIFTDRLLHRRGRDETMLLGAQVLRGAVEDLLPGTNFVTRPRFSRLSWAGQKKITRLPRRSAIVAFSAQMVYALAELIRRHRGGAAVVLGALSPRTRNAQVALYQSGEVDYLVATDAIGMGLNMDVDHVAFAARRKFDGLQQRNLSASELAQIAGRAGRHMNDGTFGVTGKADIFEPELIERLEDHRFEPMRMLQWRNHDLDYSTIDDLLASLLEAPSHARLTRTLTTPDLAALDALGRDESIVAMNPRNEDVVRLWDVCQIPDYRNVSSAEHAHIVAQIYRFLMGEGRIPDDWFSRQLGYCDRAEGDIDTLSARIAHVRTWTFVANRGDWLADPLYWQGRAREIEDRLSDALHERLTQRFIDRRTSVLMRRLRQKEDLMSTIEDDGAISVEGEYVGRIKGFQFVPDGTAGFDGKTLKAASLKTVAQEIGIRAQAVAAAPDPDLDLSAGGDIVWQRAEIARLVAGASVLKPRINLLADDQLAGPDRDAVQLRLENFLRRRIAAVLEPLVKLAEAEDVTGLARGLAFRLVESLGVVSREDVAGDVKTLSQEERASLRKYGVRFGAFHIFVPALLKPAATQLRLLLWALQLERDGVLNRQDMPEMPGQGLTSAAFDPASPKGFYRLIGFRVCGPRAVRIDMLERLGDLIRARVFWKPAFPEQLRPAGSVVGGGFTVIPDMMSLVGCSGEEFASVLRALGFQAEERRVPVEAQPVEAQNATEAAQASEPEITQTSDGDPEVPVPAEPDVPAPADPEPTGPAEPDIQVPGDPQAPTPEQPEVPPPADLDAEASTQTEAEAPAPSETVVQVWWPKDTGPFRKQTRPHKARDGKPGETRPRGRPERRGKAHADKTPDGKQQDGKPRDGKGRDAARDDKRKGKQTQHPRHGSGAREPAAPSDSPFAVLAPLKAQLAGRKR
ncbi:MAG TPA: helicase-related protein [Aestuariivirgaceae bacterium]|nr:helicase-related protein [Aestuariivirgaceae bacterium]